MSGISLLKNYLKVIILGVLFYSGVEYTSNFNDFNSAIE